MPGTATMEDVNNSIKSFNDDYNLNFALSDFLEAVFAEREKQKNTGVEIDEIELQHTVFSGVAKKFCYQYAVQQISAGEEPEVENLTALVRKLSDAVFFEYSATEEGVKIK